MKPKINPKPTEILSDVDHGDDMQRRIRYQAAYAAILAVSFLTDISEWTTLYCELHEDVLLERRNGQFDGVQVKTKANGESFKSTETAIIKAVRRFVEQELRFPGEYFRFVLAASPGFYHLREDRANLPHLLRLAREVPDDQTLADYLITIAKETTFSSSDIASVLRKIECYRLPDLDSIHADLLEQLATLPQLQQRPCYQVTRIRNRLVELMREAASLPSLPDRYYLPFLSDRREAEAQATIVRKRFTAEQIKRIVEDTFSDPYPHVHPQADEVLSPSRVVAEMYARPEHLKIFISSKMRGGTLEREREAAINAVDRTGFARAWAWERSGHLSEVSDEEECLGQAFTSDALVLILADELTPMARKEYEAAHRAGMPCHILLKQGTERNAAASDFIERQKALGIGAVQFRNLSELRTRITDTLWKRAVRATRQENLRFRTSPEGTGSS